MRADFVVIENPEIATEHRERKDRDRLDRKANGHFQRAGIVHLRRRLVSNEPTNPANLFPDGIHPNQAGQQALANYVYSEISNGASAAQSQLLIRSVRPHLA